MATKKAKEIATEQAGPAKPAESTKSKDVDAVIPGKSVIQTMLNGVDKNVKDLLPRVIKLEREAREVSASQSRMIAQYTTFTKSIDERVLNITKNIAFSEGMKFAITIAETNLAKVSKLSSRAELSQHGELLPVWWLATIMGCYEYLLPTKPIQPSEESPPLLKIKKLERAVDDE